MTEQEIFDKVCTHLRKQRAKSVSEHGYCMYRGPGGRMCAVGCLIPDELYSVGMEGEDAGQLVVKHASLGLAPHAVLLVSLQRIHDCAPQPLWENQLMELASKRGLEWTP